MKKVSILVLGLLVTMPAMAFKKNSLEYLRTYETMGQGACEAKVYNREVHCIADCYAKNALSVNIPEKLLANWCADKCDLEYDKEYDKYSLAYTQVYEAVVIGACKNNFYTPEVYCHANCSASKISRLHDRGHEVSNDDVLSVMNKCSTKCAKKYNKIYEKAIKKAKKN